MTPERYTVAVAQMDSQSDWEENMAVAAEFAAEAAQKGARLLAFPETMNYIGHGIKDHAELIPGPTTDRLCALAKQYGIWIHGGTITHAAGEALPRNTATLINPSGRIVAAYSKTHLFDVTLESGLSYHESGYTTPGKGLTVVKTPLGTLGLAVCYDLRFCELFRLMRVAGAEIFVVPACFMMNTGRDHWEPLLQVRAIENGCYIVAPNQIGKKSKNQAYGKSMVVDPWGNIIAQAPDRPGLIFAEIDLSHEESIRRQLPSFAHRRTDLYRLETDCLTVVDAMGGER